MENYTSPEDALEDLRNRGYNTDLDTDSFCLYCSDLDLRLNPQAYHVDDTIEVEDPSRPDGSETVYAVSTYTGVKGIIVDVHDTDPRRA